MCYAPGCLYSIPFEFNSCVTPQVVSYSLFFYIQPTCYALGCLYPLFRGFNPRFCTRLIRSKTFKRFLSKIQFPEQNTCFSSLPYFQFLKMAKRGNCRHRILSGPCVSFRVRDVSLCSSKSVQFLSSPIVWVQGFINFIMYVSLLLF